MVFPKETNDYALAAGDGITLHDGKPKLTNTALMFDTSKGDAHKTVVIRFDFLPIQTSEYQATTQTL